MYCIFIGTYQQWLDFLKDNIAKSNFRRYSNQSISLANGELWRFMNYKSSIDKFIGFKFDKIKVTRRFPLLSIAKIAGENMESDNDNYIEFID